MTEWKKVKLKEVSDFTTGKLNSNAAVAGGEYPFFTCSPETLQIDTYAFDQEALLLAGNNAEGNFSLKYYYGRFNAYQRTYVISSKDNNVLGLKFLYYSLRLCLKLFKDLSQGTATKFLTASILNNFEIVLPPVDIQKSVTRILASIDDKIELNTQINHNLEEQARAIFREYFQPHEKVVPLGSLCQCLLGGTPNRNKSEFWGGDIPWINSGKINEFRITTASEYITDSGFKNSSTKLLPCHTTVIAITGATLGQVSLLEIASCANQSVVGVLPNENVPFTFIYPFIKDNILELISNQTGGAQQHINKQNVESLPVPCYSSVLIAEYHERVSPLYEQIGNNCFESERLTDLRDLLLPKLMSGEIDVSEVEI